MARNLKNTVLGNAVRARGIVLIEFAIILPLLLLLTFAVMEYGWMFTKAGEVTNAARQGVRIGVRPDATAEDVTSAIEAMMAKSGFEAGEYTATLTPADPSSLVPGDEFVVSIVVPYANVNITSFPLIPTPDQIGAEVTMSKEGPEEG